MKKILFAIATIALLASCSGEADKLRQERDSLIIANQKVQEQVNGYHEVVSIMSDGLESIARQQGMLISNESGDGGMLSKEQMLANLMYFEDVLAKQRTRIAVLEDSLKQYNPQETMRLQDIIRKLDKQLAEKELEVKALQEQIRKKDFDIAQLRSDIDKLSEINRKQSDEMNTAWVLIADEDRLEDLDIKVRRGIRMENIRKNMCRRVDIRNFSQITFEGDDPEVLTPQPSDSYVIKEVGRDRYTLYILDRSRFWRNTHYLVIQNDD